MAFKYVYSTTRVRTLSYKLLSENQLERLIGAKSLEEAFRVIQDTFLESFVYTKVADISEPMENCLNQAKTLISSIAPKKNVIDFLWNEFDFFNLKILTKGKITNQSIDEIRKKATFPGNFSLDELLKAYEENNLSSLNVYFEKAVKEAEMSPESNIDLIFDKNYLENQKEKSEELKNKFIKQFVEKVVDIFNFKTSLRVKFLRSQNISIDDIFIEGGKISKTDLENKPRSEIIKLMGNTKKWKEAIDNYDKTGNFSEIEKCSEEHLLDFLTEKSMRIFTLATFFAYFYRLKNNLHIIRTIILGKEMGLPELEIRKYLKKLY